jgi:hypothetical protein
MAPGCDWAHHGPIEGGGSSGGVASERRRRGLWRRGRDCSDSAEERGGAGQQASGGALVGPREEVRSVRWHWERAERWAHHDSGNGEEAALCKHVKGRAVAFYWHG